MSKFQTQSDWTINQLETYGFVTRNTALKNYISRLGAIICDLKKADWKIKGEYVKTPNGKDYKYTVIK
jgi:hypothetical protein